MEIEEELITFISDVDNGLSAPQKYLSSKYFYDDNGSKIFQQIMKMPEYYLTNSEFEILKEQSFDIHKATGFDQGFNIIELGAGDGAKTIELLRELTERNCDFTYMPIDISEKAIKLLENNVFSELPQVNIQSRVGDYFEILKELSFNEKPGLILFMGANIGNYSDNEVLVLLGEIHRFMKPGDQLMIGFDLKKNPHTIRLAYDDPHGITKAFNMNLLTRINRELEANFDLDQFDFYATYNPETGEVKSYLISLENQEVRIDALEKTFHFAKDELIYTEQSKKYSHRQIEQIAQKCGFKVLRNFTDSRSYFVDSLWKRV